MLLNNPKIDTQIHKHRKTLTDSTKQTRSGEKLEINNTKFKEKKSKPIVWNKFRLLSTMQSAFQMVYTTSNNDF